MTLAAGVNWERVGDEQGIGRRHALAWRRRRDDDDVMSANSLVLAGNRPFDSYLCPTCPAQIVIKRRLTGRAGSMSDRGATTSSEREMKRSDGCEMKYLCRTISPSVAIGWAFTHPSGVPARICHARPTTTSATSTGERIANCRVLRAYVNLTAINPPVNMHCRERRRLRLCERALLHW